MDDLRYTYAVARINALSITFLTREFASRMLAADSGEIPRLLGETVYAESLGAVETPGQMERGLIRELTKTYALLENICPDKESIRLFRERYDFHNLKAMLKSRVTGTPDATAIVDLGTCELGDLSAAVREENYRSIPEHLRDTALEASRAYEETGTLNAISYACDRAMWKHLMLNARRQRNKIVADLFREYVNLTNIKAFFRTKEFGEDPALFERYFVPGGTYTLDFFCHHMEQEFALFLDELSKTQYERRIVGEGFKMWPDEKSFWRLEAACEDFILEHFWKKRLQLFNIAPLIYYLLRRIAETKLIRTVARCKLVGMPRGEIEERLRYVYV